MSLLKIEEIKIEEIDQKKWVRVYFSGGYIWVPALIEQAIIAQKVAECEEMKYEFSKQPRKMPIEFLLRALQGEKIKMLANEYQLTHTRAFKYFYGG